MVRYRYICLAGALMRGDEAMAWLIVALPDSFFAPFDDMIRAAWLAGAADEMARR
jgi:hypothetical protein